ncbi:MAG TPA: hypothetical protein VKV05_01195 [Terriglobales bacterium]|nr:hypothetical protein [Terriglobales bacterium]
MATEDSNYDALRNPQVDYERADLSARGILLFLVGLLIAGVFIELVIWGMFRFMARSEVLFAHSQVNNPMLQKERAATEGGTRSVLQNAPAVNFRTFPQPRLQTEDAVDMTRFLNSEQELLNVKQPFADSTGAIHIPISLAMKLIVERGLPVRPNPPPHQVNTQTAAGNIKMLDVHAGPLGPEAGESSSRKPGGEAPPAKPAGGA